MVSRMALVSSRGDGVTCGSGSRSEHRGIGGAGSRFMSQIVALTWRGQDQGPDLEGWWLWVVGSGALAPGLR